MNKINWLFFTLFAFTIFACKDDEDPVVDTTDPEITLTSPAEGASYAIGESIPLQGTVSDNDVVARLLVNITGPVQFDDLELQVNQASQDFNQTITVGEEFEPGDYTMTISAEDVTGNTATATRTITITEGDTGEPGDEGTIEATGFEEGFNTLGGVDEEGNVLGTPVTYTITGGDGIDSVNVSARAPGGREVVNQGYNQQWFNDQGINTEGDFTFTDDVRFPNVAAAEGATDFTVNTYRGGQQVGTQTYNTTVGPAPGARRVNFNVTGPENLPAGSRVFTSGNFQPNPYTVNDPNYELTRNEETGAYQTSMYTTGDLNYSYSLLNEDGTTAWEVDEECVEAVEGTGARNYVFADREVGEGEDDDFDETVNFAGYGECIE